MSEDKSPFYSPIFNQAVKVRAQDSRLSSDGGVFILREVDQVLGLVDSFASQLYDPRDQIKIRYTLTELLREQIYSQAQGYSADDDMDILAQDPAMRVATWDRSGDQVLEERMASQPTQSRLIDILANYKGNLESVRSALSDWVERHLRATGNDRMVVRGTLDIDSFPIQAHGSQPGAVYNGYYKEKIYHPLVAGFCPDGDYDSERLGDGFVHAILRGGNCHTAAGGLRFIREAVKKCSTLAKSVDVRIDAGFTFGTILDGLTDDGVHFVGRLKSNAVLDRMAIPFLKRPPGRPPEEGYEKVIELGKYQAEDWRHSQRVLLVVVDEPDPKTGFLDLFPRHFFLVTNWSRKARMSYKLLEQYRARGTFEDRIGEFQNHISPHLSYKRFEENEASLLLSLLSFNLTSIIRGEIESDSPNGWDLGRVQKTVLKAAVRITKGGHRLFVDVAFAVAGFWVRLFERIKKWRLSSRWPEPRKPSRRPFMPPPAHAHLSLVLRE